MMEKKLKCLIIEDEPIAAEVLKDYVEQVSFLELVAICSDAIFAYEQMMKQSIDVIFLDIHLPKLKGLDFLKSLPTPPQTIMTTAYHQYAIDGYDMNVVDYLLKPIEFGRFLQAVSKLSKNPPKENIVAESSSPSKRAFHFFNVNKKNIKIFFDEVLYVESLKDYSKIVTAEKSLVVRNQIGVLEQLFEPYNFIRIHRSFMVALEKIQSYSNSEIEVAGKLLPIGRSYKVIVEQKLNAMG